MKKTAYIMAVLAMAAVAFIGCATAPAAMSGPVSNSYQTVPMTGESLPPATLSANQPPVGSRTVRTYIRPDGSYTSNSSEAIRVAGFRIGFWGSPGAMLYPSKAGAIQQWRCGSAEVENAIFECEAKALEFLADANRRKIAMGWRKTLDNKPAFADPSRPGATQVYLDMPY